MCPRKPDFWRNFPDGNWNPALDQPFTSLGAVSKRNDLGQKTLLSTVT
jgi:hypothetical protein